MRHRRASVVAVLLFITLALAADVVGIVSPAALPAADVARARADADDGRDASVRAALAAALSRDDEIAIGIDAVLARATAAMPPSARALELVRQGEERLLTFEHARAASALAEAAALLEPTLSPASIDTWTRARTLAGVAWVEAGNIDAALDAFGQLLALRPDLVPDASLLSPAAREAFEAARAQVAARGTGTLEVRTGDALVVVDGQPRGHAPLTIAGLGAGLHRVTLEAPGFEPAIADVHVDAGAVVQHGGTLAPGRLRRALAGLDANAAPPLADLAIILDEARLDALVIIQVHGDTVRVRRVGTHPGGAHENAAPLDDVGARLAAALAAPAPADIDFSVELLGRRAAPAAATRPVAEVAAAPAADWWLYGAIGGGTIVVVAAAAVTLALLQPVPGRRLAVVVELPPP